MIKDNLYVTPDHILLKYISGYDFEYVGSLGNFKYMRGITPSQIVCYLGDIDKLTPYRVYKVNEQIKEWVKENE